MSLTNLPILVVEDHGINRDIAVLHLQALGFTCRTAADGAQAVEAVKANEYALILMDLMMPIMTGWEAAERIRSLEAQTGRHTPIVGVSAWSDQESKAKCLASGMDDYLGKPYDRKGLTAVAQRWIKGHDFAQKNTPVSSLERENPE